MKNLCLIYLLLKSFFNMTFTVFDVLLAGVLVDTISSSNTGSKPSYLNMIANMSGPAKLPEAFADFRYETGEWLKGIGD